MIILLRLLEELNEIMNLNHVTQKKVLINGNYRYQQLLDTSVGTGFCMFLALFFSFLSLVLEIKNY